MTINFDVLPDYRRWTNLLVDDELPADIQLGRGVKLKEGSDYFYQSDGGEGILVPLKEHDREYAINPFAFRSGVSNSIWVRIRWENGKEDMYPARDVLLRLQDIAREDDTEELNRVTAPMIPCVPGQIVISDGKTYAMIPTRAEIMYFLVDKEVIKDNLQISTVAKFINIDTKLTTYRRLDQIDEITEGFVDLVCYEAEGECITVLKTNPESEFLNNCIKLNKPIQLLGEFTTDLQLKLLNLRNN